MYFNLSAFVPLYVDDNFNGQISTKMIGALISAMELAGVIFSPIHGVTISMMGRKNAWLGGIAAVIIGTFMLGSMAYVSSDYWAVYYIVSVVGRFLQGYGDSLALTVICSQISS
jgi:predicted MFS family arabinose efflux permease